MVYNNAFKCNECPRCNDERGCPMWWEIIVTGEDGVPKSIKRCGYAWLPEILIELTKALKMPQSAFESMRNILKPLMDMLEDQGQVHLLRIGQ